MMDEDDGRWRLCVWPGCPDRLDLGAVMDGRAEPRGWVQQVLSLNYLCGTHARAGHLPRREGVRVVCECGWVSAGQVVGEPASTLAILRAIWRQHVIDSAAAVVALTNPGED